LAGKKLPELARGMARTVREFYVARRETNALVICAADPSGIAVVLASGEMSRLISDR